MARFSYKAATPDGKLARGAVEAADLDAAISALKSSGAVPLDVRPERSAAGKTFGPRRKKYDILTFTAELSSLLNAGLPLDKALSVLAGITESKGMRQRVKSILDAVKGGSSFSEALGMQPDVFPTLYLNMVRAGESGGVLEVVLENLSQFLEARKELKDQVSSAMIYPVILLATSGVAIAFLVTYVLPKFSTIFEDTWSSLPLSTRLLMEASASLRTYWWVVPALALLVWVSLRSYSRSRQGRRRLDELKIRLLGGVVVKMETARFCRTLGTLLASGVPLLPALNNSRAVMSNQVMADALDGVSRDLSEGKAIAVSLSKADMFPQLAVSMIQVGEETGQLSEMLLKVASIYEKSLKSAIRKLTGFLEPALILCMGLTVGFIVVSMLSAIFSITNISF